MTKPFFNTLIATLAVLGVVIPSQAGVIISGSAVSTVGLAGYATWTLTATTDNGAQIVGFDFASQPSFGFFGSMNQVNPAGIATVFADNNAFFPFVGADVSQDSQFKFLSTTMTVPAGFASESNTQLRALFASGVGLGTSVQFVQIATSGTIYGLGQIQTQLPGQNPVDNWVSINNCLGCIPPQIVDATINNVDANNPGVVNHTVQFVNIGGSLSNFVFDSFLPPPGGSGTGPATPATLDLGTRKFSWNTVGSPLGTYKWTFTATNNYGFDNGSITVNITVPEPASIASLGLAAVVIISRVRRR